MVVEEAWVQPKVDAKERDGGVDGGRAERGVVLSNKWDRRECLMGSVGHTSINTERCRQKLEDENKEEDEQEEEAREGNECGVEERREDAGTSNDADQEEDEGEVDLEATAAAVAAMFE